MSLFAYFRSLSARFFRREEIEQDLTDELQSHIQLHAEKLERYGLTRAEAERRARIEFGGQERFKEECRDSGPLKILRFRLRKVAGINRNNDSLAAVK